MRLCESYKKLIKDGEEKAPLGLIVQVQLSIDTYDVVDAHIKRLDEDLMRFEEEQLTGPKLLSNKYVPPTSNSYQTSAPRPRRVCLLNFYPQTETPKKRKADVDADEVIVNTSRRAPPVSSAPVVAAGDDQAVFVPSAPVVPVPKKVLPARQASLKK